jgi:translation initiation factor IF-2
MGKKRIFEVAKELGVKTSEVLDILAKNKIVKSTLSVADEKVIAVVSKHFKGKSGTTEKSKPAAKPAKPAVKHVAKEEAKPVHKTAAKPAPKAEVKHTVKAEPAKVQVKTEPVKPVHATTKPAVQKPASESMPKAQAAAPAKQPAAVKPSTPVAKPAVAHTTPTTQPAATQPAVTRPQQPVQQHTAQSSDNRFRNQNTGSRPTGSQGQNNYHSQNQPRHQGGIFIGPHGQGQGGQRSGGYQGQRSGGYQGQGGQRSGGYQGQRSGGYQGQGGQRSGGYQGQRSGGYQGQGGQRSGGYQGQRTGGYQGQGGQRSGGYQGGQRSGGYQGQGGQRSGGYQGGQRSGGYQGGGNRFQGGNHGGYQGQGGGHNFNRPGQGNRRQAPKNSLTADLPRGKESREKYNKKHGHDFVKGSYATRDSRPNRNTDHMGRNNKHQKGRDRNQQPIPQTPVVEIKRPSMVKVGDSIQVKEFASLIKREVSEVIKSLFMLGVMVTINQDIDFDTAVLVGTEFDVDVQPLPPEEDPTEVPEVEDDPELRSPRPPVVTVMGHVDHGKTSLLDAIRKTNVTAREAGGITQHIGAYTVNLQGKKIVFLDTPGHEAFTAMRARGAQCTDIAVLVVAADDGVMPQTLEAIHHAKAAKVPIIVAINKMDKPGANPEHVKEQLMEQELVPEEYGGDTIMVPVSAKQKTGLKDLLEMILLVADMKELKANPDLPAHGVVIEAQLDKGRGPVATVLIQRGTLKVGDYILVGTTYGKVRALINDKGEKVRKALPSTPVEVLGLNDVPMAGDTMDATDERTARTIAGKRVAKIRNEEVHKVGKVSLDDIFKRIQEGELKELNILVKADVQGTIEALRSSLEHIKNDEVKVVVVHSGVGAINESDIMLASAANALIIGFNVRPDANARKLGEQEKVDIRTYRVIYDAINDVEAAIKGMLAPKFKENIIGRVEVRQVITISKMLIAGCYVTEGKVTSRAKVRVVRDGIVIAEDEMESLRRFKDDVREVTSGFECGITLTNFHDIKEGDVFEIFVMEEVKPE